MNNKVDKIKNKITQLQIDLIRVEVAIQRNIEKRTIFKNEHLIKQKEGYLAQRRNIIKAIEFNKRKLEKQNIY